MTAEETFVIVGAGLAGAKAAQTLRDEGFEGRLVLVGSEDERPYERPPLSKDYLRGEAGRERIYVHDEDFYADNDIELVLDPNTVPLERVLGREVGALYRDIHRDHGVRMLMGTRVEAFEGAGAVERVRTTDGRSL